MSAVLCEECQKPLEGITWRKPGVSHHHGACWIKRLKREIEQAPDDAARKFREEFLAVVLSNMAT